MCSLKPFEKISPVYGLCFIAVLSGILLLKIFGLVSNQKAIKKNRAKIKAYILEVVLYRDNMNISLNAILKMLKYNIVYMKYIIIPLIVMIIPFMFIFAQLNLRYSTQSLNKGEETIVTVKAEKESAFKEFSILVSDGLKVTTPALRIKEKDEIYWRIKALIMGKQIVKIIDNTSREYTLPVMVNTQRLKLPAVRYKNRLKSLLNPGVKALDSKSAVKTIRIRYPEVTYKIFNLHLHWLIIFLIVSVFGGLAFKKFLGVEI